MTSEESPPFKHVIGFPVTALAFNHQISLIMTWAKDRISRVVCIANVHMLIEAYRKPDFASVLRTADLVTPDGMPLVWMLKLLGSRNQDRVAGLDVLLAICEFASEQQISVFFLGSQLSILQTMKARLNNEFPNLLIAGMEPLPFRPSTWAEDEAIIQQLNQSGAGIVFVSLGCPKQEVWMAEHKGRIHAVMIGLGGAFPVYAGIHRRAPEFVRSLGFEWLFRLAQEPRRLWRRYIGTIPIFIWLATKQLVQKEKEDFTQGP
jgi:N-acetylglucosaminyldiphosphoundecaprenol N-acetyl-beta-D-mannosaminyltransferase